MTNMKMTNKEDIDGGSAYDSHFAAFLAVHLVRKILDDACFIANATAQSCQSRYYESGVKDIQQPEVNNEDHKDVSYKGESDVTKENNIDLVANIVTTSTPQKDIGDNLKCMMEASFIGQGDEDLDNEIGGMAVEDTSSTEESRYSLLSDAFTGNDRPDIAFYIQDTEDIVANSGDVTDIVPAVQIIEKHDENHQECMQRNDVARLESAYLSLNRDYEQSCEDDGRLIIEDTKGMTLQEVELLTADSSDENLSRHDEVKTEDKNEKAKELTAVSAVSAVSKKSLVSRCRSQGARLLSCLRGWWRRKVPGQRKEHQRVTGGAHGLCPLSPDARRRAASLVDQRLLRSPSPSRSVVWKFNTVNETVVNSSHWKDYTFEKQPHDCGEGYIT